jgi:hypothetical protein
MRMSVIPAATKKYIPYTKRVNKLYEGKDGCEWWSRMYAYHQIDRIVVSLEFLLRRWSCVGLIIFPGFEAIRREYRMNDGR